MLDEQPREIHRRLRNRIRNCDVVDSLVCIWRVLQNQDGAIDLLPEFEAPLSYRYANGQDKKLLAPPWQLEELALQVLINSKENSAPKNKLSHWGEFARSVNDIKDLENSVYGVASDKIDFWAHFHRMVYKQIPWQIFPSKQNLIRYVTLYSHKDVKKYFEMEFQTTADILFTILFAILGNFRNKPTMPENYADFWPSNVRNTVFDLIARFSSEVSRISTTLKSEILIDESFGYRFNQLGITPLIYFPRRRGYLLPIWRLLWWRCVNGLYYDLLRHDGFLIKFGQSFQSYIGKIIFAFFKEYRKEDIRILSEQEYHASKNRKDSIDWIVAQRNTALFIEVKTKRYITRS